MHALHRLRVNAPPAVHLVSVNVITKGEGENMSKLRKHDLVSVMGLPGDFRVEVISAHAHTAMVLPRRGTLEPRTYPIGDLILLSRPVEPGDIICQFRPGADFTNTAPLSKFTVTSHLEAFKAWGAAGWKHSDGTPIEDPPGASEAVVEEEQKKPEPVALRSGDVVESRTSGAVGVVSGFKREIPHALGKAITLAVEVTWRDETKASMLPGDLRLLGRMLKKGDRLVSPRSDHNGMVFTINQRVRPHDRTIYMVPTTRSHETTWVSASGGSLTRGSETSHRSICASGSHTMKSYSCRRRKQTLTASLSGSHSPRWSQPTSEPFVHKPTASSVARHRGAPNTSTQLPRRHQASGGHNNLPATSAHPTGIEGPATP